MEAAFRVHPDARVLAFVHAETSTGAQSDAAALAAIVRRHGALTIIDCVTSLGGTPVLIDARRIQFGRQSQLLAGQIQEGRRIPFAG